MSGSQSQLTIFYMCEPGRLEWQAICLASSIMTFCLDDFKLVAYCSHQKMSALRPETIKFHQDHGIPLVGLETEGIFAKRYDVGGKVVASSQPRESPWHVFMDTDMVLVNSTSFAEFFCPGMVSAMPTITRNLGYGEEDWRYIYTKFGVKMPKLRFRMDYQANRTELCFPYYNGGLLVFPTGEFGATWLDVTRAIQRDPGSPPLGPWLDQISLPVAILKAGLRLGIVDRRFNFPVEDKSKEIWPDIRIAHYHFGINLETCSRAALINTILATLSPFSDLEALFSHYGHIGYVQRNSGTRAE